MTAIPPVTLVEFKKHLNRSEAESPDDTELTTHLRAATEAIEQRVGPLVNRDVTERVRVRPSAHQRSDRGTFLLALEQTPVVAVAGITSVVSGTVTPITGLVVDELDIDLESGLIDLGYLRGASRVYEVTYTAGRGLIDAVPDRFKLAVLIVAEHLWQTQRGTGARPSMFGVNAEPTANSAHAADYIYRGFALPNRALELIANDQTVSIA